jgi:hypothetical protein
LEDIYRLYITIDNLSKWRGECNEHHIK